MKIYRPLPCDGLTRGTPCSSCLRLELAADATRPRVVGPELVDGKCIDYIAARRPTPVRVTPAAPAEISAEPTIETIEAPIAPEAVGQTDPMQLQLVPAGGAQ